MTSRTQSLITCLDEAPNDFEGPPAPLTPQHAYKLARQVWGPFGAAAIAGGQYVVGCRLRRKSTKMVVRGTSPESFEQAFDVALEAEGR